LRESGVTISAPLGDASRDAGERSNAESRSGVVEVGSGGHHGLFEEESQPGEQGPGGGVFGLRVELVLFGDVQPGAEKEP